MEKIRVALLGFGNVGRAFAAAKFLPSIVAVADRSCGLPVSGKEELRALLAHKSAGHPLRDFGNSKESFPLSHLVDRLLDLGVNVLVESLPTNLTDGQPALDWVQEALLRGISVVTVDKGPLVHGYDKLVAAAIAGGARFAFQGTAGVWPSVDLRTKQVVEIRGILNGTTNFILSKMCETGYGFKAALRDAHARGISEPNPRLDLDGWDAAAKILILAKSHMGIRASLSDVTRIGIGPTTQTMVRAASTTGRVVRLMACAGMSSGMLNVSVSPEILGPESPFYHVSGTSKAAIFRTAGGGEVFVPGQSGREVISEIILQDIRSVMGDSA